MSSEHNLPPKRTRWPLRLVELQDIANNLSDLSSEEEFYDSDADPVYNQSSSDSGTDTSEHSLHSGTSFTEVEIAQSSTERISDEERENEELPAVDQNTATTLIHNTFGSSWCPVADRKIIIKSFTLNTGIRPDVAVVLHGGSPGEYYTAIIDDNIINFIVNQTNLYADQTLQKDDVLPASRLHDWTPTTKTEIKHFLALVAYMGLNKLPSLSDYWSSDELYNINFARRLMSRNRFELLLGMIHFSDNDAQIPEGDKLSKLRPLLEKILSNNKALYEPEEYVCVDETLLPFRGRLGMRQYMKQKRHKYGVKIFKLCSGMGYTYNLTIYTGKQIDGSKTTPLGIVMELTEDILNTGRTVVTDNWYTSVILAKRLVDSDTHLVGTIRKNRKSLPKEVVAKKLKKGQTFAQQSTEGLTFMNWKDNRNVFMLSTKHTDKMVEVRGTRGSKLKPETVCDYNKAKGSVDLSDQMGAYSNPLRRSLKWYRKIAFELLLTTSMVNAYILYKQNEENSISITDFKKSGVKYLAATEHQVENLQDNEVTKKRRLTHEITRKEGVKHKIRKMCKLCYQKNKEQFGRKEATNKTKKVDTYCKTCHGEPFFCIPCFNEHAKS